MGDVKSRIPGFILGEPLSSHGVSEVIASKRSEFPVGTIIYNPSTRWEELSVISSGFEGLKILPKARELASRIPLSNYVGILGMPGKNSPDGALSLPGVQNIRIVQD